MATNRRNIFSILCQYGDVFKRGQCALRNNKEVILSAYKINSHAFHYASDELKNDKEFIKELMQINPVGIIYASEEIQHDKEFLSDILLEMPEVIGILDIKEDKEFVTEIAKKNGAVLLGLDKKYRGDKEFLSEIIKETPSALLSVDPSIRKDKEYIKEMMKNNDNFQILLYADDSIREDKEFVLDLLDSCPSAILYAGEKIQSDKEFMLKAARKSTFVSVSLKGELVKDEEFRQEVSNIELNKIKTEKPTLSEQIAAGINITESEMSDVQKEFNNYMISREDRVHQNNEIG